MPYFFYISRTKSKAVHELVQVGFVPSLEPIHQIWVAKKLTCRKQSKTTGWVNFSLGWQQFVSGRNQQISMVEISTNLVKIWSNLDRSHQNLVGFQQILSKSGWILTDLVEIWPNLAGFTFGERRSLVGLVGLKFSCEDMPTDWLNLVSKNENPPPTITNGKSSEFRSGSEDLSGWVGSRVKMDSPN